MIKKDIYEKNIKQALTAASQDKIHRFVMADRHIRGAIVNGTRMVNEMRANHELGSLETLILGQAYIAASLMSTTLKGNDRISIQVRCDGPVGGLDVESNVFGEIRGFLKHPVIRIDSSQQVATLSSLFGGGDLTVTKYLEDAVTPYSGTVALRYRTLAQDLANYYLESEQIPTAFTLSVFFDENETVAGAGGIFLQALPGVDDQMVMAAERILGSVPPVGETLFNGGTPESIVRKEFCSLEPELFSSARVEFFCRCSKDRMAGYLSSLPEKDLIDIKTNGPFPVELRCHHCNSLYSFSRSEIAALSAR